MRLGGVLQRFPSSCRDHGPGIVKLEKSVADRCNFELSNLETVEASALFFIEQVRPELNGLFREEDYPSAEKLRAKFGVKLEVLPIPSGDDFRVTLSEEEQARSRVKSTRVSASRSTAGPKTFGCG